jgi:hypothetical protein
MVMSATLRVTHELGFGIELRRGRFEVLVDGRTVGSVEDRQRHRLPGWSLDLAEVRRFEMTEQEPVAELSPFSSPGAVQTEWSRARAELANAEVYWLSTVRPDGRPHVTPLLGVWLDGALYFCTGPDERKAKNLSENLHCVLTTGHNTLEGLDLVLEGTAERTSDPVELGRVADTCESKYGAHFAAPNGTWSGLGDAIRRADALVYRVAPMTAFGFGKGKSFSQTRWRFS